VPQSVGAHGGAAEQTGTAENIGAVGNTGTAENMSAAGRHYRIWCDPTFGPYLGESLGAVVIECGGRYTGVS
jgi:hypothetical protein